MTKIEVTPLSKWQAEIHREWIEQIAPLVTRPNGVFGAYVVGGAARGIATGKTDYNDIDVCVVDPETLKTVKTFFTRNFQFIYETQYSYTFELPISGFPANRVQLLKIRVGDPGSVLKTFPLTVEQFAVVLTPGDQEYKVYSGYRSVRDAYDETVRINPDTDVHPDGILYRAFKYVGKGFKVANDFYPSFFERCAAYDFDLDSIREMIVSESDEHHYGSRGKYVS